MSQSTAFFGIQGSYIEIKNYVIINLNPVTSSVTEYEDYELSAESFLIELNTMDVLPSMKMHSRKTNIAAEQDDSTAPQDDQPVNTERGGHESESSSDGEVSSHHAVATAERKEVRAEIIRNITASPEAENNGTTTPDTLGTDNESDSAYEENFELSSSPKGDGSDSPHTDPDFMSSSSDGTDVELILRSGMVGLKVSDFLISVEGEGAKSVRGVLHRHDGEGVEECKGRDEKIDKIAVVGEIANCDMEDEDENRNFEAKESLGVEKSEKDKRRRELKNVSLAASATAVLFAAIWIMERSAA